MDELRRAADGLTAAELDRARAQIKAGMLMGLESPSARAERLARMLRSGAGCRTIDEIIAKIDAVTPERLRAFARAAWPSRARPGAGAPRPGRGRAGPRGAGEAAGGLRRARAELPPLRVARRSRPQRIDPAPAGDGRPRAPGRCCAATARASCATGSRPGPRTISRRKAFRNRVYWAWRAREEGRALALFLIRREDARLMGAITLDNIRRGPSQSAQVGYWIGPEFARQGMMTEALAAVVHHAFAVLDLSRIEAACLPENVASRALLERSGFKYEGVAAELPADRRPLAQPRALRQPARRPAGGRRPRGDDRALAGRGRRRRARSSGWRRRSGPGGVVPPEPRYLEEPRGRFHGRAAAVLRPGLDRGGRGGGGDLRRGAGRDRALFRRHRAGRRAGLRSRGRCR